MVITLAQGVSLISPNCRIKTEARPNWSLAPLFDFEAESRLLPWPGMLSSPAELDEYCSRLIDAIQALIKNNIPMSKGGQPRNN